MRRLLAGSLSLVAFSGTILVLPVSAAPAPEAEPVTTSGDQVPMGSVTAPAPAADVQPGTTEPVPGVPDTTPALTVSRTGEQFSLVGLTWEHDDAVTDVAVQIRVQDASGGWGEWTAVDIEDAEQNAGANPRGEARGGTSPLWTGPSTGVEAELVTRAGAAPRDVQLELIDPGSSPADAAVVATDAAVLDSAHAASAAPPVLSRLQWGADERIRTWAPSYAATIKAATVHHTATANDYTAEDVPAILRSIYRYHAVSRGWGDIGYNMVVDRFGRAWEGRFGGLASTVMGAHAGGFNTATFGISLLGDYDKIAPPGAQLDMVAAAVAWKLSLYGVDPRGTTTLTSSGGGTSRFAAGVKVTLPTVFAHREVGNTTCPGVHAFARMGDLRAAVTALVDAAPQATIAQRYAVDGELRARLGAAVGPEQVSAGVTWQVYERGRLYWTPRTGAHLVTGAIANAYVAAGGPAALGAPLTDELPALDGRGRYNDFAGSASIYWTSATGAHVVKGAIRSLWKRTGAETGPLGYPTTDELAGAGGRYSDFQRGTAYWAPGAGAVEVHGAIASRWKALGGLSWAVPTSSELAVGSTGGRYSTFSGNRALYWSSATGTRLVQGAIHKTWLARGGATGPLGLPTSDELAGPDGMRWSTFAGGTVVWTAAGGTRVLQGAISRHYVARGGADSGFGVPLTDERATPDGAGRYNHFARSTSIYWSRDTGARAVQGAIRAAWARLGWERGPLRYPTSDELPTADGRGRYSTFQKGAVYWTPARGAFAVYGSIHTRYRALGGETSALGLPTSAEYAVPGGRASDFEGGRIVWNTAARTATVTYS